MVRKSSRTKLYAAIAVLAALLIIVAVIAFIKSHSSTPVSDSQTESSQTSSPTPQKKEASTTTPATSESNSGSQSSIDPATVSSVDIAPMSLTVSYMKGVGGFDYAVQRTPSGAQYVQFSASELKGTKCTNDDGTFAYIIQNPSSDDTSTITKTANVDGTPYGLSIADSTCTSDAGLLKQYQDAFSDAFTLLKKM